MISSIDLRLCMSVVFLSALINQSNGGKPDANQISMSVSMDNF